MEVSMQIPHVDVRECVCDFEAVHAFSISWAKLTAHRIGPGMGWESTCAQRPTAAARPSSTQAAPPVERSTSSAALLAPPTKHEQLADAQAAKPWSIRKTVGAAALFITSLWIVCFGVTSLLIYALLRFT